MALVEAFIIEDGGAQECDDSPYCGDLNRRRRFAAGVSRQLSKLNVDDCASRCWNALPIPGRKLRNLMSYDMSLGMQWMVLTCRATFSGPHGRRTIPFCVLTPGDVELYR